MPLTEAGREKLRKLGREVGAKNLIPQKKGEPAPPGAGRPKDELTAPIKAMWDEVMPTDTDPIKLEDGKTRNRTYGEKFLMSLYEQACRGNNHAMNIICKAKGLFPDYGKASKGAGGALGQSYDADGNPIPTGSFVVTRDQVIDRMLTIAAAKDPKQIEAVSHG